MRIDDLEPLEHEALLRSLQYWQEHWDWECPALFGFGLEELSLLVDEWPASVASNAPLMATALLSAFRELLYGASSVARKDVPAVLGLSYADASLLLDRLKPRIHAAMGEGPSVQYLELIQMMEAFVSGTSRSRELVAKMEVSFAASPLDEDERFSDLQLALALFGAGKREDDERMLAAECRYALRLLYEKPA